MDMDIVNGENQEIKQDGKIEEIFEDPNHNLDMNKFLQDDNRFQSLIDMTYNNGRNVLDGIFQQYLNAIKKGSVSVASLIAEF